MASELRFNREFPVLPVACGVYQSGYRYGFEVEDFGYCESVLEYARLYTDSQVVLAYPKHKADLVSPECEVFKLGTVIKIKSSELICKGDTRSYCIETSDTQKAEIIRFSTSPEGVRLARCRPHNEQSQHLSNEQTMALLLPIWISIRANLGVADSLTSFLPCHGSVCFGEYMGNLDRCLDSVCQFLPLKFEQQAELFAAEGVTERAMLVLNYLNKAHASGFKVGLQDVTLAELYHWNRSAKSSKN